MYIIAFCMITSIKQHNIDTVESDAFPRLFTENFQKVFVFSCPEMPYSKRKNIQEKYTVG